MSTSPMSTQATAGPQSMEIPSAALLLQPNSESVAAEMIDGDAIIINVVSGTYYSTQGIGGWVWQQCVSGKSITEIVIAACTLFEVNREQLESDLLSFAAALKEENLVTEIYVTSQNRGPEAMCSAEKLPYQAPSLLIYRDLKDLLALDPPMPRLGLPR